MKRLDFKNDHEFAAFLRRHGWTGDYRKNETVENVNEFIAPNGQLIAVVAYDNAACRSVIYVD